MIGGTSLRFVRTRQAMLFLLAIALPCGLLVFLTLRMLVQDRELTTRRLGDERHRIAAEARGVLLERAERLRMAAAEDDRVHPDVPIVARVRGGRIVFAWEELASAEAAPSASARFLAHVARGERLEFTSDSFQEAASAYRAAAAAADRPTARASAELLIARALAKAGHHAAATRAARELLKLPATVVDDEGVPLVLYAARLLEKAGSRADVGDVAEALKRVLDSRTVPPAAVYMAADLAAGGHAADLARRAALRVTDLEAALKLRASASAAGLGRSAGAEAVWTTFLAEGVFWLVNVRPGETEWAVLTAIRAEAVLASFRDGVDVRAGGDGEVLTPNFPTLVAAVLPTATAALERELGRQRPLYVASLVVVISVALAGAYLFWRDVQREMRMSDLRSQFVSSVSHELKTPLTAIRMFAEMLLMRQGAATQTHQDYLETIVNESERLTRLLNNVLDFSKIEGGARSYRLEPTALATVVHAAARAMHYPLEQQGFDLRVAVDDDVPLVAADADAMEQAVLNLLSNAMKYSGDARRIDLSLCRDGDEALIAVTDRGVGIRVEDQQRIFDKFYRVQDVVTNRVAGTGLGLTLVDHVVRGHRGSVEVASELGRGSTFTVRLPLLGLSEAEVQTAGAVA